VRYLYQPELQVSVFLKPTSDRRSSTSYLTTTRDLTAQIFAMAYVVPIHRPTTVRHALLAKFLHPDEDNLIVA
jgi:hypothetical protein